MEKLSIVLKKLRESRNLTIVELANKAGLGKGTVGDIETGRSKSTVETLNKIAIALELNENEKDLLDSAFLGRKITQSKKNDSKSKLQYIGQIKQKKIPFFPDIQASAGYGCLNEDETELEFIEVPEELAKPGNIAIRVFGESMEPEIKDGDTIVIETKCVECIKNKIIVVNYQGAVYLKKYVEEENNSYLVSINPYYPRIKVLDKTEFRVIGRLKGVMRYY
jgi:phage repressor protein C with HTH and peptisase S24 domain